MLICQVYVYALLFLDIKPLSSYPSTSTTHLFLFTRYLFIYLFERSESLIDTSQKKSLRVCRVHACTRVRLLLVLVLGRQIVYGQNTVYLCLSKYSPTGSRCTTRSIAKKSPTGSLPPAVPLAITPRSARGRTRLTTVTSISCRSC